MSDSDKLIYQANSNTCDECATFRCVVNGSFKGREIKQCSSCGRSSFNNISMPVAWNGDIFMCQTIDCGVTLAHML